VYDYTVISNSKEFSLKNFDYSAYFLSKVEFNRGHVFVGNSKPTLYFVSALLAAHSIA
jgi:hypothetical protein